MNTQEALSLFDKHGVRNIYVQHKTSKKIYLLNRDIVEAQAGTDGDGYVYAMRPTQRIWGRNPGSHTQWFHLRNVNFVDPFTY